MKETLVELSKRYPVAGLVLQMNNQFYRIDNGELRETIWTAATPPPAISRMSVVHLPRYGGPPLPPPPLPPGPWAPGQAPQA